MHNNSITYRFDSTRGVLIPADEHREDPSTWRLPDTGPGPGVEHHPALPEHRRRPIS